MNLKLQSGQTFESPFGYEHGDYVAIINHIDFMPMEKELNVSVGIYKSLTDYQNGARQEVSKDYNVSDSQYDTVVSAIESKIQSGKTFEQALYELLLTRPMWSDWELNL